MSDTVGEIRPIFLISRNKSLESYVLSEIKFLKMTEKASTPVVPPTMNGESGAEAVDPHSLQELTSFVSLKFAVNILKILFY